MFWNLHWLWKHFSENRKVLIHQWSIREGSSITEQRNGIKKHNYWEGFGEIYEKASLSNIKEQTAWCERRQSIRDPGPKLFISNYLLSCAFGRGNPKIGNQCYPWQTNTIRISLWVPINILAVAFWVNYSLWQLFHGRGCCNYSIYISQSQTSAWSQIEMSLEYLIQESLELFPYAQVPCLRIAN